ncbi:hypothetical protein CKAN_02789100 [Cinnamomum micranthum f. kanehirae]|uniref:Protein TIC 214 n=1 Tax=Cinnamomum micranthum f. kanehirae TaxID=337451 RepID=A0A443Q5P2_9MAGN|nr:hypothetical protein CKAN_02789100 [Cinnamomum micranthum f. kanehirae]
MLLFQFPEWYEDLKEWNREMHVKCTYNGVQLSETEFPKNWLTDGIQIKILFPFCLKPWRKSKLRSHHRDPIQKKGKTEKIFETELPFGSARQQPSFFEPIYNEFEKKKRKVKKKFFLVLRVFKKKNKTVYKGLKRKKTRWIIKTILFLKRKIKEFANVNPIFLFVLKKVYEPNENGKDSIIISSNKIKKKRKDLSDRTTLIRNQIERGEKDKRKIFLTPDINISPNDTSCGDKRSESQKHIWQISKGRSNRFIFIRKWHYFLTFFNERIYIHIFLCTVNVSRVNVQLFLESTKKIIDKYIHKEGIDETNQKKMHFISTIKKSLSNISQNKSKISGDLYSFSQASVFYKLSQIQAINKKYHLRSLLQYREAYLILKDRIRNFFWNTKNIRFQIKA